METREPCVGDKIILLNTHQHNSQVREYSPSIVCNIEEIGKIFTISSIKIGSDDELGYKITCEKGITYLRRDAFELIEDNLINEDMTYLINILKNINVI